LVINFASYKITLSPCICIHQTQIIWNLEVNVILIKFAQYAQLEVYNFKISQHNLPVINRKLPESIGSTINVLMTVQYCIHNNKFHNVKIFNFLGT